MSGEVFKALAGRVEEYVRGGDASVLFADAAMDEVLSLIEYTSIAPLRGAGDRLDERELAANRLIGTFFYLRAVCSVSAASGTEISFSDLTSTPDGARAMPLLLCVFLQAPEQVPPALHPVFSELVVANDLADREDPGRRSRSDAEESHNLRTDARGSELHHLAQLLSESVAEVEPAAFASRLEYLREAVAKLPVDAPPPVRVSAVFVLVGRLLEVYARTEDIGLLNEAIELADSALRAYEPHMDEHELRELLPVVDKLYEFRFYRLGHVDDLDDRIMLTRRLAATYADDIERRDALLMSASGMHAKRYEMLRDPTDLDAIYEILRPRGFELPEEYETAGHRSVLSKSGASVSVSDRATVLGDFASGMLQASMDDGDRRYDLPILLLEAAVNEDPQANVYLSNLSAAYANRFDVTQATEDLASAVDTGLRAVAGVDPSSPDATLIYFNVSQSLLQSAMHTKDLPLARQAVDMLTAALERPDSERWSQQKSSILGFAHRRLYEISRDHLDLERAIALHEATPGDALTGEQAILMRLNLAAAYMSAHRARHAASPSFLDRALEQYLRVQEAIPEEHPLRLQIQLIYAAALRERIMLSGRNEDWEAFRAIFSGLEEDTVTVAWDRVTVLRSQGWLALHDGLAIEAAQAYRQAISTLANEAVPSYLPISDRAEILGSYHGFVGEAMAVQIAAGLPRDAVSVAEAGRGVILRQRLNERVQVSDLIDCSPDLAREFEEGRARLRDAIAPAAMGTGNRQVSARTRHDAERRLRAAVDRIRNVDSLQDFFGPPAIDKVLAASERGPLVYVNCTRASSSAVVVAAPQRVDVVSLPLLRSPDIRSYYERLANCTRDAQRASLVRDILHWLWASVAEPVLSHPALRTVEPGPLRVWWIPMGLLSAFPLHAAEAPDGASVLDLAVSSYAATANTLLAARSAALMESSTSRRGGKLIVAVSEGRPPKDGKVLAPLPGAAAEASDLLSLMPDAALLSGSAATVNGVLGTLPSASWLHFAGHAMCDLSSPASSWLALSDGDVDVVQLSEMELENPELVYLSACDTARGGSAQADEALTVASAFQMAGYRNAVGSLWPLNDAAATSAAKRFYRNLMDSGGGADDSAHALRAACLDLRAEYPSRPDYWAGLVHSGP